MSKIKRRDKDILIKKKCQTLCNALSKTIAKILKIPFHSAKIFLTKEPAFLAKTEILGKTPRIFLSYDSISPGVLAHELTHCFVPTPWLFFAEGLATYVSCTVTGHCNDLFFSEATLNEVIKKFWNGIPSIDQLLDEHITHRCYLSSEGFYRLSFRLAHVIAASFCGYLLNSFPNFAKIVANSSENIPPKQVLQTISNSDFRELEKFWKRSIYESS